jgi:hypothetical protein
MRKGAQALSPESEIGLVGELTLLRVIIDAGVPPVTAIESWVGPFDGVQDFNLGTGSLEVKATLSMTGFPAKIGSLEQLDDFVRQPLFLPGHGCIKQRLDGPCRSLLQRCGILPLVTQDPYACLVSD